MRKNIQFKMLFSFSIIVIAVCLIISAVNYFTTTNLVKETISKQAGLIASQAGKLIDVEKYKEINIESGENEYYHELRNELNQLRNITGLVYLYTMSREKKGNTYEYYYMVDGMPPEDENASNLGDVEEGAETDFPKMVAAFETGKIQSDMTYTEEYGGMVSTYIPIKDANGKLVGIIGADFDVTNVYQLLDKNKKSMIVITLVILIISILFIFAFSHYLIRPLKQLTAQVSKIRKGDLSIFTPSERSDEIGILSKAFSQMVIDLRMMIQGINQNSNQLINNSKQLLSHTQEVRIGSEQVSSSIHEVAQTAETQYRSSEDCASAMVEMTKGIQQIATASSTVTELSASTLKEAEKGFEKVENAVNHMGTMNHSVQMSESAMKKLETRSEEISNIVLMISEISSQTNLLALNAAIEAARAGEHGKGFAVVANEVKKLAEQSQRSAENIQQLIMNMSEDTSQTVSTLNIVINDVQRGIDVVEKAGESFHTILMAMKEIDYKIQEVSGTSEEMFASTEEISATVSESSSMAEKSANRTKIIENVVFEQEKHVGEMSQEIEKLNGMAEELRGLVQKFQL
ncbi:methyl-accepting chemotaxis protein [Bacillus sp. CGMCC 1.16607]|uniref:methyl-accepting chemotaxis protein n=1 Tax=Bacillus sp. CGMCC 1.16607 TaxID=3351842 RepID=UPI003637A868